MRYSTQNTDNLIYQVHYGLQICRDVSLIDILSFCFGYLLNKIFPDFKSFLKQLYCHFDFLYLFLEKKPIWTLPKSTHCGTAIM